VAADRNLLETPAQVKRQIMLNGGVMAAVSIAEEFSAYPQGFPSGVYTDPARLKGILPGAAHAVFCFG
jgi:hypothetical protein